MKIAVVGAGFAGLAVAAALVDDPFFQGSEIVLFDKNEIGKSTSGMAAGLLHPFAGAHAKLNFLGREGMQEAEKLLEKAKTSFHLPVESSREGILRIAIKEEQTRDYLLCAKNYPEEVVWLSEEEVQKRVPNAIYAPGILIKEGRSIYSSCYLQGLWNYVERRGVLLVKQLIEDVKQLEGYDQVLFTTGSETLNIGGLSSIKMKRVKGQLLELAWPESVPPLSVSLNSRVYLVMSSDKASCYVGSTFEKEWKEEGPERDYAEKELLPFAFELFPPLEGAKVLNCFSGFRAVTDRHLPLIKECGPRLWLLTGMGSKGLLYHALYAKMLIEKVKASDSYSLNS